MPTDLASLDLQEHGEAVAVGPLRQRRGAGERPLTAGLAGNSSMASSVYSAMRLSRSRLFRAATCRWTMPAKSRRGPAAARAVRILAPLAREDPFDVEDIRDLPHPLQHSA